MQDQTVESTPCPRMMTAQAIIQNNNDLIYPKTASIMSGSAPRGTPLTAHESG